MTDMSTTRAIRGFDWTSIEPTISHFTQDDLDAACLSEAEALEKIRSLFVALATTTPEEQ